MGVGYRPSTTTSSSRPNDKDESPSLSTADHMWCGGISSAGTRAVCQPLDVLKIRLQVQLESGAGAKYRSLPQTASCILREEGITAFWKGHLPAQCLSVTYGVVQFASFEALTKAAFLANPRATPDGALGSVLHFFCGATAGVAGTVFSYPFDVVRTRLVAQPGKGVYSGSVQAFRAIVSSSEGARGLFRGIVPTFASIAPYSGLQFGFYNAFMQLADLAIPDGDKMSSGKSIASGAMAGLCAKIAVFPFDTTKKRMQVSGFSEGRRGMGRTLHCHGMLDCMRATVRTEGPRGLFKGLSPGLIKAVIVTSINFWLYEWCIQVAKAMRTKS